jgi:hypothetical protein
VAGQGAQGDGTDSPYLYSLLYPVRGRMVTGYRRSVADRELARVRLDIAATVPGSSGLRRVNTALTDFDTGFFGPFLPIRLPSVRTEFVNADAGVESGGSVIEAASGDASTIAESDGHRAYRAGQTYEQSWNRGVFAPHLATPAGMWDGVTRTGDRITVGVGRFGDGDGRPGDSTAQVRTTALYRDGVQVADAEGTVGVPADDGTYRLELTTERGAPFDLSTKTRAVWTFGSGHADAFTPLPLWDVRFTPDLDRYNAVPAGRTGRVPVAVTAQPGSSPGTLGRVTVEVSFDDGATWRATPLRNGAVQVTTPTGKGFVSLRTKAADSAGNSVEQTVVHAYRFG